MRSQPTLDCIAFVGPLIGAFAWSYVVTDVKSLDQVHDRIWDPLDDAMFLAIATSGLCWLARVLAPARTPPGAR